MMFIVYFEYNPLHADVVFRKLEEIQEARKETPSKYPKFLSGPYHFSGEFKGIIICEAERDETQIVNFHSYLQPEVLINFFPILDLEAAKGIIRKN